MYVYIFIHQYLSRTETMIMQIIYPKAYKRKRKSDPAVEYVRCKIELDLWQKVS